MMFRLMYCTFFLLILKLFYLRNSYYDMHYNKLSEDPDEQKLYYYREDILYHMFHDLFHTIVRREWSRQWEQFWYGHQQMMRR